MPGYVAVPYAAEHRPRPGLLRRAHARRAAQPVRDRRRPERAELPGAEPEPRRRADAREARRPPLAARSTSTRRAAHLDELPDDARRWTGSRREAFEFVTGPAAREAFDIGKEDPQLRDRYGRTNWGQIDAARPAAGRGRLDVRHRPPRRLGPPLGPEEGLRELPAEGGRAGRRRCSSDLDDRGLLDTTLVVLCGEFSRTPKMNDGGNGGAADEPGHARPRPLGQRDVLPDGRRRREGRAGRRLDRPARPAAAARGR